MDLIERVGWFMLFGQFFGERFCVDLMLLILSCTQLDFFL